MQTREAYGLDSRQKDSEESGAESELGNHDKTGGISVLTVLCADESRARTKYQRTSLAAVDNDSLSFRKPTAPASASRAPQTDLKNASLAHRRKSTLKENRVPLLGPRPFESPNKSKRFGRQPM